MLTEYRVTYRQGSNNDDDDSLGAYDFWADDAEHALEQFRDAEPNYLDIRVVEVYQKIVEDK